MKRAAIVLLTALTLTGCGPRQEPTYAPVTSVVTPIATSAPDPQPTQEKLDPSITNPELLDPGTDQDWDGVEGGSGGGILCKDGTASHAKHRQGACSHHGGIA